MKSVFKLLYLFTILCSLSMNAQQRINKNGRITGKYFDLDNVAVQNITLGKIVFTEKGGYFKVPITVNDTLIFTSESFKRTAYVIKPDDVRSRFLYIALSPNEETLEELVIDGRKNSNSYFEAKARKRGLYKSLYTATSGGLIATFINFLSGRTEMIKKAIRYEEENEMAENMINSMSESYFVDELLIPKEYIGGFGYFLLQDPDVVTAVKTRNTFQLEFLMPYKAEMYLETLKEYKQ